MVLVRCHRCCNFERMEGRDFIVSAAASTWSHVGFVLIDRCCPRKSVSEISDPNGEYPDVRGIMEKIKSILRRDSMQGLTTLDEIGKCESRVNHTHRVCNTHLWVQVHRQRVWGMQVHRQVAAKARSSSPARGPLDLPFSLTQRRNSNSSSKAEG